jgi:hypothetical protein
MFSRFKVKENQIDKNFGNVFVKNSFSIGNVNFIF